MEHIEAMERLEKSLAYENACELVETHCDEVEDRYGLWLLARQLPEAKAEALRYLEYRGLIERHPHRADLIRILDEDFSGTAEEEEEA